MKEERPSGPSWKAPGFWILIFVVAVLGLGAISGALLDDPGVDECVTETGACATS